jgi:Type II secretion system (T2SS), protein N
LRRLLILAASGFVLMLIVRFPARWISPLLPQGMHCEQLDGSAWHGRCAGLTAGGSPMGDLAWDLHPLQLLLARLDLQLDLAQPGGYLRGDVALGFGSALRGRDVTLDLPLTSALVSSLPAGAHARLQGRLSRIEWTGKYFSAVQGELDLQDLVGSRGQAFGNYQATFGPDATDPPSGVVHDMGGPLALDATLQLTHDPGYLLQGQVAARPAAAPEFADQLKYLGSADASGRRPFSLAGTF